MILSKRLETIVQMIEPCDCLADIGCDHGYVSIEAVRRKKAAHVIAADVAECPLDAARRNVQNEGIADAAEFVLSDGLTAIPDDCGVNCIVNTGMGGILMKRILEEGKLTRFPELKQLVLGPQSDPDLVRRFLIEELGFSIRREMVVFDDGKYYFLLDVDAACAAQTSGTAASYSEAEYYYGKNIDPSCRDTYLDYLNHRKTALEAAYRSLQQGSREKNIEKSAELEKNMALLQTALKKEEVRYD